VNNPPCNISVPHLLLSFPYAVRLPLTRNSGHMNIPISPTLYWNFAASASIFILYVGYHEVSDVASKSLQSTVLVTWKRPQKLSTSVMFLRCVREVPGSELDWGTG